MSKYQLSIGQVAEATGISVFRLRQWERRYGHPIAQKRESGHRRYSTDEVSRLKLIIKVMSLGYRAHQAVPLSSEELTEILSKKRGSSNPVQLENQWLQYIEDWDAEGLTADFERSWKLLGPFGFVHERAAPFLIHLGQLWQQQEVTVSQEHFFSNTLENFLSHKWRKMSRENNGEAYILTSPSGEEHSLGLQMCSVLLAATGKNIIFLGKNTPIKEIVHACNNTAASGLCISYSSSYSKAKAKEDVATLLNGIPKDYQLIVGGDGAPELPEGVIQFRSLNEFKNWLQVQAN